MKSFSDMQSEYESRLEREESRRNEEMDEDFTDEDMEYFKRGGRDRPRKYRVKDDSEYFDNYFLEGDR